MHTSQRRHTGEHEGADLLHLRQQGGYGEWTASESMVGLGQGRCTLLDLLRSRSCLSVDRLDSLLSELAFLYIDLMEFAVLAENLLLWI